ncbi:MAG: FAD-binding protein [Flavobacteriales bacterium]|nr:FAD-binding protein [Flavobacteriales bacterium]MCB9448108.1 FAD-binding protein [Flavobacteriales bacterium]
MKVKQRYTWRNSIKHLAVQPLKYWIPESLDDLVEIINEATRQGLRVRAVGSGHSFSDVAITGDYLVDTHSLNRFLKINKDQLKDDWVSRNLVEVECGITIHDLNKGLDSRQMAIINMGGIDHQTFGGASSTATHGSGRSLPALPGMVHSFVMVTESGEIQRIEPSNGITDPARYTNSKIRLVQNDDVFHSALVGFGGFGLIYSYTIETRDMYYIREDRVLRKWAEVKAAILDGSIHKDDDGSELRSVSVRVNPYIVKGQSDHTAILIRHRDLTEKPTKRGLGGATRPILLSILGSIPGMPRLALMWMQLNPRKIPKIVESSLTGMKDRIYTNRAHKVLFLGQVRMKEHGMDSEFAFDANDPARLVAVMEKLFATAEHVSTISNLYHSSQIGMRWVRSSGHYMAPDYNMDVCYIDTPNVARTKGAYEITSHYQDVQFSMGGRPHWGKLHNRITSGYLDRIGAWYPMFGVWKEVFALYNKRGTFRNAFTDRLGVGQDASAEA